MLALGGGNPADAGYLVTFVAGKLGLGFVNMPDGTFVVDKTSGQSVLQGVNLGSTILCVSGKQCDKDMDSNALLGMISSNPRPLLMKFSAPSVQMLAAATEVRGRESGADQEVPAAAEYVHPFLQFLWRAINDSRNQDTIAWGKHATSLMTQLLTTCSLLHRPTRQRRVDQMHGALRPETLQWQALCT